MTLAQNGGHPIPKKRLPPTQKSEMSRDFGRQVWAPDAKEGYVLGTLDDIGTEEITVVRKDGQGQIKASYDEVFPAEDDPKKTVDDNCALMYLNEGTLLNNCRQRYSKKQIYTYVANILISINPYEEIENLYSIDTIKKYRGKSLGQMPPHVYAVADKAYREMRRNKESQSIIVSGESGAGKTESQKAILRYLCENWGAAAGPIQKRILETNPILEAFGNAKTLRNNNSSRFGKFVEIHFGTDDKVAGGYVSHYLLEKSRVCRQADGERNYHIFYQLIAGAPDDLYKRLRLAPPDKFKYLKHGTTTFFVRPGSKSRISSERLSEQARKSGLLVDAIVDDAADFSHLADALGRAGLTKEEIGDIWRTVAGVLHLGNVEFDENPNDNRGGCMVDPGSEQALIIASELLGLEISEMKMGLVSRIMQATKGGVKGTLIRVPLKPHEAAAGRDALAKAFYSKLFDWLVSRINKSIPFEKSVSYIGVLDIAGFEFFEVNSFEQFCINYCNEKLQNFFNERILKQEQELYAKEGLNVPKIDYSDNHDCIELFEKKPSGLLDLLDEESRLPRPTPQHYTMAAYGSNKGHFRLESPRRSRLRQHRDLREDEAFLVRHYAGTVCYQTAQFLDKNNDTLHNSLEFLVEQSSVPFIRNLFEGSHAPEPAPGRRSGSGRLQAATVGGKFRSQLTILLEKLRETGTHFVRCVKPNSTMSAGICDGAAILSQLKCAGMASVLKLMQKGFPSRTSFADLYEMYRRQLPPDLARLDPRLFCKCLFHALGLNNVDYKFGQTKVFFRPGKFAEFDQLLRQDPEQMRELINKVRSWLLKARWRKAQYGAWSVIKLARKIAYRAQLITRIQSHLRGYIARKQFKPRLDLYRKSISLLDRSHEMMSVINQLQPVSREKWTGTVRETTNSIETLVSNVRRSSDFEFELDRALVCYQQCVQRVDHTIAQLKKQLAADEQQKLLELERKRREEEEEAARQRAEEERLEQERLQRKQLAEEREKEEQRYKLAMATEAQRAEELRIQEEQRMASAERERLDATIATRLSRDGGGAMMDTPTTSMSSGSSIDSTTKPKGKYDLSTWRYAELRDTINTSTDMELLLACKEEFHRRLRIYNAWKSRNQSQQENETPRAPNAVYANAQISERTVIAPQVNPALIMQRYFKVPFSRPADIYKNHNNNNNNNNCLITDSRTVQNGLWYAHFNGQWIQRQIEMHPNKTPVLLVAGRDDLHMCEIPLDQTGLTRKKGAEILETEFETVWLHLGGAPMQKWRP
uniref:Myosin heavy chain 95F n=2 Tax=Haemonchus contortus TaxID=6289 RepID=A0A7I4XXY4_HAECO